MTAVKAKTPSPKFSRAECEAIWTEACEAGVAAARGMTPTPMVVGSPTTPLGHDIDLRKPTYFVPDGVCGFAWVTVTPGNSSFARWLKATNRARKGYYGGMEHWISGYNQSMEKKLAHARAVATVLQAHGITAYAGSRMD